MSMPGQTSAADGESPGAFIRSLRVAKGLTLTQVSAKTGLAISTLSKLEKGHVSLSYDKLMLISKGLDVDVATLLDPQTQAQAPSAGHALGTGRRVTQRAGEGQLVDTNSYRQVYLATELLNKKMVPIAVEVRARTLAEFTAEFGGLIRHPGEEFTLVLNGELEFCSELYAPVRLKAGDSIYFDSEMGHAYLKVGEAPCHMICVCASRGDGDSRMTQLFVNASERIEHEPEPAPAARKVARRSR